MIVLALMAAFSLTEPEVDGTPPMMLAAQLLTAEQRMWVTEGFPDTGPLVLGRRLLFVGRAVVAGNRVCRRDGVRVALGRAGAREQLFVSTTPLTVKTDRPAVQLAVSNGPAATSTCAGLTGRRGFVDLWGQEPAASARLLDRTTAAITAARGSLPPFFVLCAECDDPLATLAALDPQAVSDLKITPGRFIGEAGPHVSYGGVGIGYRRWAVELSPAEGPIERVILRLEAIPVS